MRFFSITLVTVIFAVITSAHPTILDDSVSPTFLKRRYTITLPTIPTIPDVPAVPAVPSPTPRAQRNQEDDNDNENENDNEDESPAPPQEQELPSVEKRQDTINVPAIPAIPAVPAVPAVPSPRPRNHS